VAEVARTTIDTFANRVCYAMDEANSLVCVGLDPDFSRFPAHLRELGVKEAIIRFNRAIIESTRDLVCAYKPNLGFYLACGIPGLEALIETRAMIPTDIPAILDCKVGDVGSTAAAYARGIFDEWKFDAATVNPFLGEDSLAPFLSYPDRGVIVLCKTSNPGSGEWQDLVVGEPEGEELFLKLAGRITRWAHDYPASVGLVVGATYPEQLAHVRERCPDLQILLPGIGAQAGDLEASVANGLDGHGRGLIVTSSRAIIYAGSGADFAERARIAATKLRDAVNAVRTSKSDVQS
jgi:orotidine-5'-phosphate decarboxylase